MHRKLTLVLAVLAMVTGSASAARAAALPAEVSSVARAPGPAAMPGRGGIGATGAAAPQRRLAHPRGLREESDQRSLPGRVIPATVSGTMIHPAQPRRHDASAFPVTAYVTNFYEGTVTPIATATNTAGTPITVGSLAAGIAITPNGKTAYVASQGSGTVTPIATATNTVGTPITVGHGSDAIAITPNGRTAYVANYTGTVTPIATATNTAGTPITIGNEPAAIAITPNGKTAYVTNDVTSGTVTPIATATNTAGTPITVGSDPTGIAITPNGKTAYVTNYGSGTVTPIAAATNTAGAPITVGRGPIGIAITPDGKTAYVTNYIADTVTPIATATNTAGTPITVGNEPQAVAITPNGKTAYVTSFEPGVVTPIATATNTAGAPITVADPEAIAITPVPPLAAPSGLAATLAGPASGPPSGVALTWTDNATAPPATLVRIERASDPGFTADVTDFPLGAAATSYTDTAVVEGATYYYRVRAENDSTPSAWSDPVSITFTTVPAAPASLTATVTGPVSGPPAGVSLNWTDTSGGAPVAHMVVRRATNPGFTTGLADFPLAAAATSYTDTAVAQGTTYYYRVRAENEASNSAWSNTVSVLYTTVPAAPAGLTATLTASLSVLLKWTVHANTSPATHLRIERAANSRFTSHVATILVNPAASTYTDNNVEWAGPTTTGCRPRTTSAAPPGQTSPRSPGGHGSPSGTRPAPHSPPQSRLPRPPPRSRTTPWPGS